MFARKDQTRTEKKDPEAPENTAAKASHPIYPENYKCCAHFLKFVFVVMLVIFGRGMSP